MAALDQRELVSLASDIHTSRLALVITMTAIAYDYLLSIREEAEYVWTSRLSAIKILFLLNRYAPFVGMAGLCYVYISFDVSDHPEGCVPAFWAFASFVFIQFYLSGLILAARAYAVWGGKRERKPLLVLCAICVLFWAPAFYYGIRFLRSATLVELQIFPSGCLINLDGHIDFLSMIDLLVSETAAVAALLIKAMQIPQSSIMKHMSSDGILFYIVILSATIANLIVLRTTSPAICNFLLAPQAALHSICCNHLLLRIRKSAGRTEVFHDSQQLTLSPRESFLPPSQISGEGIEMHSL